MLAKTQVVLVLLVSLIAEKANFEQKCTTNYQPSDFNNINKIHAVVSPLSSKSKKISVSGTTSNKNDSVRTISPGKPNGKMDPSEIGKAYFRKEIIALKNQFPNQSRDTWIQFLATIGKTLNKETPQYPGVITALLPTSMPDSFAICFLKKVGIALNKAVSLHNEAVYHPKILTPGTFTNASITEIRSEIELYLKNKGKALMVQDIDKFKSQDHLMVFHGICDNYNAVDVRATVIFPVRVPGNIFQNYKNEWSHNRGGDISNEVLQNAWKGVVSSNVGPALVARIADAVVLLNDGDHCQDDELKKTEKPSPVVVEIHAKGELTPTHYTAQGGGANTEKVSTEVAEYKEWNLMEIPRQHTRFPPANQKTKPPVHRKAPPAHPKGLQHTTKNKAPQHTKKYKASSTPKNTKAPAYQKNKALRLPKKTKSPSRS